MQPKRARSIVSSYWLPGFAMAASKVIERIQMPSLFLESENGMGYRFGGCKGPIEQTAARIGQLPHHRYYAPHSGQADAGRRCLSCALN